jgi:hypothetical protein
MAFFGPASSWSPIQNAVQGTASRRESVQSGVYNDRRRCRTCSPAGACLQDACTRKRRYLSYTSTRKNFRHTGRIYEWLTGTSDIALSYRQFLCELFKASPRRDFGRFSNSPPTGRIASRSFFGRFGRATTHTCQSFEPSQPTFALPPQPGCPGRSRRRRQNCL